MSKALGDKRFYSFQLRKYWKGNPTKFDVVLTLGELGYLTLIMDGEECSNANLEVVSNKSYLIFKKNDKPPFYFPNAALDKFKVYLQKILLLGKNQKLDDPAVAETILLYVIQEIFGEELESLKNLKYLDKATILGTYFNISKEAFEEVMNLNISESRYLPLNIESKELFNFLLDYNKSIKNK